jgi:hypothetical protein
MSTQNTASITQFKNIYNIKIHLCDLCQLCTGQVLVSLQPQEVVRLEIEGGGVETGLKRHERVKKYKIVLTVN